MRVFLIFVGLIVGFSGFLNEALARDTETTIAQCRKSTRTLSDQITCLENALRQSNPNANAPVSVTNRSDNFSGDASELPPRRSIVGSLTKRLPFGLGAERVPLEGELKEQSRRDAAQAEFSTVVDFAYNKEGKLVLVLSNGQAWKQLSSDLQTVSLQDGDSPQISIRRGAVSGYRLKFIEANRTMTVTRVR
ncbi:hypothetical protein MNBD_ALPHA06-150 [hydrothermal vent metagenome]|uniref:Uncharacterized protein n=1 Tax=hydrothermal vent metagenome TaxID=652676 RepID=A0A3B0RTN6_9ZZZZ